MRDAFPGRVQIIHRAFLLRPEEQERRFTEYQLQHRRAAGQLTGLPYHLPEAGSPYPRSSLPALEAAEWVKRHAPERFDAFDLALYEAFFRETRDIGSPAVLAALAEDAGIPAAGLDPALRTGTCRGDVWEDFREALERGVTAIPTVFIGEAVISGAVPYADYAREAYRALGMERA